MAKPVGRRQLLAGAGAGLVLGGLSGCGTPSGRVDEPKALTLARLQLSPDQITRITVCTRPFRPLGPRIEAEKYDDTLLVHNYGHGGSGWSLSWGSAALASQKAIASGDRKIGVIGCGAIGLTTALALQRAGAEVTIYAKELPPNVRSSLASGIWSPDSRICLEQHATPALKQQWEFMCRQSYQTYQTLLGLPGDPISYYDSYYVAADPAPASAAKPAPRPPFAELQRELVPDLRTPSREYLPGSHSLGNRSLYGSPWMMFNISAYSRLLLGDFLGFGGKIVIAEFHSPTELRALPQKTLVNCTGYGARALFGDMSVIPVRGQLARMAPKSEINYGFFYQKTSFIPRRDGLVFQYVGDDDYYGYNDDSTSPDRAEAEKAVNTIASLFV